MTHSSQKNWIALLLSVLLVSGTGLACWFAWTLPLPKPQAVLGRLNYMQFVMAGLSTVLFLLLSALVFCAPKNRRAFSFRIVAVCLGIALVIAPWEACAWLLPGEQLSNPYYTSTATGLKSSRDLPYERPAHLKWRGRALGDIAIEHGGSDPYARIVTFQTDFEGFRNSRDIRKAELIFIGDSFTEAGYLPDEETFPHLVGQKLKLTMRNLGRNGYTTSSELVVLRKYGLKCQPRVVVWQVAENNDLKDALAFQEWIAVGRPVNRFASKISWAEAWKRRSPSYLLFRRLIQRQPPLAGTFRDASGKAYPIWFRDVPSLHQDPIGHPGWPFLAGAIRRGAELLQENQVHLLVLLAPMKMRVMGEYVEFSESSLSKLPLNWQFMPENTLAEQLHQLCDLQGVAFIDPTERLKNEVAKGRLTYLPFDTHLSSEGHAIVAELVVQALREKL